MNNNGNTILNNTKEHISKFMQKLEQKNKKREEKQ